MTKITVVFPAERSIKEPKNDIVSQSQKSKNSDQCCCREPAEAGLYKGSNCIANEASWTSKEKILKFEISMTSLATYHKYLRGRLKHSHQALSLCHFYCWGRPPKFRQLSTVPLGESELGVTCPHGFRFSTCFVEANMKPSCIFFKPNFKSLYYLTVGVARAQMSCGPVDPLLSILNWGLSWLEDLGSGSTFAYFHLEVA